jgi:hypothetical protein
MCSCCQRRHFRFPLPIFYLRSFPYSDPFTLIGAIGTLNGTVSSLSGSWPTLLSTHSKHIGLHDPTRDWFPDARMSRLLDGSPSQFIPFHPNPSQIGVGLRQCIPTPPSQRCGGHLWLYGGANTAPHRRENKLLYHLFAHMSSHFGVNSLKTLKHCHPERRTSAGTGSPDRADFARAGAGSRDERKSKLSRQAGVLLGSPITRGFCVFGWTPR